MSRTQIKLRIDLASAYGGVPEKRLNQGEIAVGTVGGGGTEVRLGLAASTAYFDSPIAMQGRPGAAQLMLPEGATEGSGIGELVTIEGGEFELGAEPIGFAASQSGAVVYDDSEDEWSTDPALVATTVLDGGIYAGGEPPAFTTATLIIGAET